jgi:hypothetical protein
MSKATPGQSGLYSWPSGGWPKLVDWGSLRHELALEITSGGQRLSHLAPQVVSFTSNSHPLCIHPSICMHYMHMIGGLVYICGSRLELKLKIDDPLDAFAVHDHVESGMNMSPFLALS